jgi:hypothetical protein
MRGPHFIAILALLFVPLACAPAPQAVEPAAPAELDPAHVAAVEEWRARRDQRLRAADGWLSLAGLYWLEEGENRFGSDPANDLVLPAGAAPAQAGALQVTGKEVTLRAAPGAGLTVAGQPVTNLALRTDAIPEGPTVVELGRLSFQVIERNGKLAVRLKDRENPALLAFTGMEYFPIAAAWRVEGRLEPYQPPKQIPVPNALGWVENSPSPGAIVFEMDGKEHRLDPILEPGETDLFVIFGDPTNGKETYGAGRFLYAKPPGPDGKVVLDFNQAYNPPCVFTPYATCPLPPRQNRLPFRVEAGEKKYAKEVAKG